jgi:hypothetical protein
MVVHEMDDVVAGSTHDCLPGTMNVNESDRAFGSAFSIEIGFVPPTSTIRARGTPACIASVREMQSIR